MDFKKMTIEKINDLYQDIILEHNQTPFNFYKMKKATNYFKGFNPFCGDQIEIFCNIKKHTIKEISFWSQGCAISKASASIMTSLLQNCTIPEALDMFSLFYQYLTINKKVKLTYKMRELVVFQRIRHFPIRIKCASLPWHTMKSALEKKSI
jgi:nitrogen fixation NifU-like protein